MISQNDSNLDSFNWFYENMSHYSIVCIVPCFKVLVLVQGARLQIAGLEGRANTSFQVHFGSANKSTLKTIRNSYFLWNVINCSFVKNNVPDKTKGKWYDLRTVNLMLVVNQIEYSLAFLLVNPWRIFYSKRHHFRKNGKEKRIFA